MRRVEGSTLVRHQREPKLLLSEVPRNRMGRLQTGNYVYIIPHTIDLNSEFTFLGSVKTSFKDPTPPGGGGPLTNSNSTKNLNSLIPKPQSEAKKIDVISRIVFPASFLAFNVMYWSYYLTRNVKVK